MQYAVRLEQEGIRALSEPIQIPSALPIPSPASPTIRSLTTTRTTPATKTTSCGLRANEDLRRTLRAMEQQNTRLPHELSMFFAKTDKQLLQLHRGAAKHVLGATFAAAKAHPLPLLVQASPAGTNAVSSGSAYGTAHSSVAVGKSLVGMDAGANELEWVKELRHEAERQQQQEEGGSQKEEEYKPKKAGKSQAKVKPNLAEEKAGKEYNSIESTKSTSSAGEQPPAKTKDTQKGKAPTRKMPAKATPKLATAAKPKGKRTLEEAVEGAMPPPQSPCWTCEAPSVGASQASTSTANVSATASVPRLCAVRAEQICSSSESDASLTTASKLKKISMSDLSNLSKILNLNIPSVMNIPFCSRYAMWFVRNFWTRW